MRHVGSQAACKDGPIGLPTDDLVALGQLHARYADVTTRQAWDELDPLFQPDCPIEIDVRIGEPRRFVGAAELSEFIARSLEQFEFFQFVVLTSVFSPSAGDPDQATGRMYMSELRQHRIGGRWTQIYGLYQDRYVRVDRRWRYAARRYTTLARPGPEVEVFPIPAAVDRDA